MKLITLTTAAIALTVAAQAYAPAHAAADDRFVFHYTVGDLADAERREQIERRLKREAQRHCYGAFSTQLRYSAFRRAERKCEEKIITSVQSYLNERANELMIGGND